MIIINFVKRLYWKQKYKKFVYYYKRHPAKFCEKFLGIKLNYYQKKTMEV